MTRILVRKTQIEDVEYLIDNIREADKLEIEAASGKPHYESIIMALQYCDEAWTGLIDDKIIAIFGVHVTSYITGSGVPWLISTKHIEEHPRTFLKYCKPVFKKLCVGMNSLVNYVDERNTLAKQWLEWLGFTLHDPELYGVQQMPFRRFTMEVNAMFDPVVPQIEIRRVENPVEQLDLAKDLIKANWAESMMPIELVEDDARKFYKYMADQGALFAVMAFLGKKIVGYCVASISPHPLNHSVKVVNVDGIFLQPEYRKGRASLELMDGIRNIAKDRGADYINWHAPTGSAFAKTLAARFTPLNEYFSEELKRD